MSSVPQTQFKKYQKLTPLMIKCKHCLHIIKLDVKNDKWVHSDNHWKRKCDCIYPEPVKTVKNSKGVLRNAKDYVVFGMPSQLNKPIYNNILKLHKSDGNGHLKCSGKDGEYRVLKLLYEPKQCKICFNLRNTKYKIKKRGKTDV